MVLLLSNAHAKARIVYKKRRLLRGMRTRVCHPRTGDSLQNIRKSLSELLIYERSGHSAAQIMSNAGTSENPIHTIRKVEKVQKLD